MDNTQKLIDAVCKNAWDWLDDKDCDYATTYDAVSAGVTKALEGKVIIDAGKISNRMKAENHGYHSFTITEPCPKCALHLDDHFDHVECLCDGDDEMEYEKEIDVPWNTCKSIYKAMLSTIEDES